MKRGTVVNLKISLRPSPRNEARVNKKKLKGLSEERLSSNPVPRFKSEKTLEEIWVKGSSAAQSSCCFIIESSAQPSLFGSVVQLSRHRSQCKCVTYTR